MGATRGSLLGAWRARVASVTSILLTVAVTSALAADYDYPPIRYTPQEKIPSDENKFFSDAEETSHYWGATNHKLVMRFVPEPRGYIGTAFRLRGVISSSFKLRQIKLALPRTDAYYWPADSDIVTAETFNRRRLQAVASTEEVLKISENCPVERPSAGGSLPLRGSSHTTTSASRSPPASVSPVGPPSASHLSSFSPAALNSSPSLSSSSPSSPDTPSTGSPKISSDFSFGSERPSLLLPPHSSSAAAREFSTTLVSSSPSSRQLVYPSSSPSSSSSSSFSRPSPPSRRPDTGKHSLWSAFPDLSLPKVVRHPPGTHSSHGPARHIPLHPRSHERRLVACEPLPPNTKAVVKEIFEKHGVSTDGIFMDGETEAAAASGQDVGEKEASTFFSSALQAFKQTPDTQTFDAVVEIPEILPPFHPTCPANTACGAEYCQVYGCEEEMTRKGSVLNCTSYFIAERRTCEENQGPASLTTTSSKLLWIPPKEIQLVVHVDVPAAATSMQEQWMLQILEKPVEPSQMKIYPGYEDVYQMGYNVGDVVKKKTNELFFKYLPPLRNPLRVEQIRLEGGAGLGSFNYTFSAVVTPERQRIFAEVNPQLHLTLPGPACSTAETAWVQPFGTKPIWLVNNQLRECWDLFQVCETLENGGLFGTCEVAYEKLRDDAPVARKIVLSGAPRDIPARPFTLKFSGLYPPNTNLTNSVPQWYMQVASGYPKTLKQKEERAKLDETGDTTKAVVYSHGYSKIIEDLYAAGPCIGWTFRPFIDKRLRDQKPKISHQSYFYTPQLDLLPTILRGTPSDSFPFFLNLTFSVNTLARDSTVEFTLPHKLLSRDGVGGAANAAQRYDPFTREFLTMPPPELIAQTEENGRLKLRIPGLHLKRRTPVSIYLPAPPLPRYGQISPVWADPNGLTPTGLTEEGFVVVVKDRNDKELLSTFRFPTPIFGRREIGGVIGPEFQTWNAEKNKEMALFRIFFDTGLAKSRVRLTVEVLGNSANAVDGFVLNRKDPNTCTAILRGDAELLVQVSCPQTAKEIFQVDVSTVNGERTLPTGWYVLGVVPQSSAKEIAWFRLKVLNAQKKVVFDASLLADRQRRNVRQQPCINRLSTETTRHAHTGYTTGVKFIFQLYNCLYPAQPMKPMPQQQEPLEARVPNNNAWPTKEYFSSVRVYRRAQLRQAPTPQAPLQKAMQLHLSRTHKACPTDSLPGKCTAARYGFETLDRLDPPHYLDLLKEPEMVVITPSLAASSVLFNFPTRTQAGVPLPPPGRQHPPAHKNPMSLHVRERKGVLREASGSGEDDLGDEAAEETQQIKITVHILLDEVHLDEETINAFKRFVALKIADNSEATLCLQNSGVFCYFYSYKDGKKLVAWKDDTVLETPQVKSSKLPEEGLDRDVFDQINTLVHYAKEQRRMGTKTGLMNWSIVLTHRDLTEAYETHISVNSSSSIEHATTAFPEHVLVLGWTSDVPEDVRTLQQHLQELPFSPIRRLMHDNVRDTNLQQLLGEPVFVSFLYAEPSEYLGAHVYLLRYVEEALYLIQEEYVKSFVVLDICRHPLPPKGYTYGDSIETRATEEELERPVELLFNGIPFTTLRWKIPASDAGVYTAAKLSWQFDMACDGVLAQQNT